eukprot:COSAG04_NODE_2143_length_4696_cov_2.321242_5_plen_258_part_00
MTCDCTEGFAGEFCESNCTPAEHTTGVSVDGMTCNCTEGFAGEFCQINCTEHGGASDDGLACANCTGNWIGALCDTECGCSGNGNQTNITAARAAGSCAAGSCVCDANNNTIGDACQQWALGSMVMRSGYNGATVQAVEWTGEPTRLSWELQHGLCAAAGRATPGSDNTRHRWNQATIERHQDKNCAYSPADNHVVADRCSWRNQEFTHVSGSLGGGVGYMCASGGCSHQVWVDVTTAAPWYGTTTLNSGDAVFCSP